jgi:hypothetical protein
MESSLPTQDRTIPHPLPSLPPSPTTSEDLSRAHVWAEAEDSDEPENIPQKKDKGKSKEIIDLNTERGGGGESSEDEAGGSYPPTNEDAAETRRIEDNLRKWEAAERQRRKAARESTQAPSRSLIADDSRRASLIWSGKAKHAPRPSRSERSGLGNHTALPSVDTLDVQLEDVAASPTLSATTSPGGSPKGPNSPANPFHHHFDPSSPLNDSHEQQTAVMNGSSNPPTPSSAAEKGKGVSQSERPTLVASTSSFTNPPPPKPLGLPSPRTPPPNLSSPPKPISSPTLAPITQEQEEPKESRWWHDWLCGLTEGSDRGGDNQAGRTNPFE